MERMQIGIQENIIQDFEDNWLVTWKFLPIKKCMDQW